MIVFVIDYIRFAVILRLKLEWCAISGDYLLDASVVGAS